MTQETGNSKETGPVPTSDRRIVGCREYVAFPDWGVAGIEAKIDTGARTSAIHVEEITHLRGNRVRFYLVTSRKKQFQHVPVTADIVRETRVRSSTGHTQERLVVATRVQIGAITKRVELSLVRRDKMLCRMLLGRTALSGFLVDVSRKHIHKRHKTKIKAKGSP